jgi:hypothetical protein
MVEADIHTGPRSGFVSSAAHDRFERDLTGVR